MIKELFNIHLFNPINFFFYKKKANLLCLNIYKNINVSFVFSIFFYYYYYFYFYIIIHYSVNYNLI